MGDSAQENYSHRAAVTYARLVCLGKFNLALTLGLYIGLAVSLCIYVLGATESTAPITIGYVIGPTLFTITCALVGAAMISKTSFSNWYEEASNFGRRRMQREVNRERRFFKRWFFLWAPLTAVIAFVMWCRFGTMRWAVGKY